MTTNTREQIKKYAHLFKEINVKQNTDVIKRAAEIDQAIEAEPDPKIKNALQKFKAYIGARSKYNLGHEAFKSDPLQFLD